MMLPKQKRLSFAKQNAKLKTKSKKLAMSKNNAKLKGKKIAIFSLPAGHTCPFAELCHSKSDRATGKITDGKHTQFRCYAVASEALFPAVRESRWRNFEMLKGKSVDGMALVISGSLPLGTNLVRIHQSGDFFSQDYFDAWIKVATANPHITFYGYTKALPYWITRLATIPANLKLVASRGGKFDHYIEQYGLRSVKVVFTEQEAKNFGLELDHDDTHVWNYNKSFAILLHGTQPAGSEAGKAWHKIKTKGRGGYTANYLKSYKKK